MGLFKEFDDKFDIFVNVCWTNMFNVEFIVWPSILNATLIINAICNDLIFVRLNHYEKNYEIFLLYICNNLWIISSKVRVLLNPTFLSKICVLKYYDIFVFYTWYHQILIFFLHLIV